MKQIVFFFFTFSGICTGFAQKPAEIIDSIIAKEKPSIRLYPNPAKNKVEIEIKGFDRGYVQVQLTDKNGNLVRNDKRFVFSGNEIIILMFSEKPGLYFLLLKQGKNNVRSKLIIQ
jgi:Secretion system C-terminal sorting domain